MTWSGHTPLCEPVHSTTTYTSSHSTSSKRVGCLSVSQYVPLAEQVSASLLLCMTQMHSHGTLQSSCMSADEALNTRLAKKGHRANFGCDTQNCHCSMCCYWGVVGHSAHLPGSACAASRPCTHKRGEQLLLVVRKVIF